MTNGPAEQTAVPPSAPGLHCAVELIREAGGAVTIALAGQWVRDAVRPTAREVIERLLQDSPARVRFRDAALDQWDSTLLAFLLGIEAGLGREGIAVDLDDLRDGLRRLLALATAVPEHDPRLGPSSPPTLVHEVGARAIRGWRLTALATRFVGACALAAWNAVRGRSRFRRVDFLYLLQVCGPNALGIISLIAFLMGLILAFVGAVQLRLFGAQIYIADLVGIGIVREMGAIMTGVVMAGRSGAAFAAQLGTMQVNDEIDAFRTMGIDPVEFLVLPRMLALTLMMPVLCLYADFMGVLGGAFVGVGMMNIGMVQYWNQTRQAVGLNDVAVGVVMSTVFGVLISVAGCLRGMQCGRSSLDVGRAATSAVVTGIVWIVVATAVMTVMCDVLGV